MRTIAESNERFMGAVGEGAGPEGPALVLTERLPSGTFEMRTYLYRGNVVQEYALAGSDYAPEKATPVVASGSFGFSIEGGLLTVTTDEGSAEVALRTAEGDDATADALVALEALASGGSEAGAVGGSDGVDDASGSAAEAGGARDGDE